MTLTSRRLRIAGAAGFGALLIVGALSYLQREAATAPATQPHAAVAWPIKPDQSPPKVEAQQPKPVQVATSERQNYIVQAASIDLARRAVEKAGGSVTGDLEIIRAVGASLDAMELARLHENPVDGLRVYEDAAVTASATSVLPETYYPQEVGATTLHKGGLTGRGVSVAVLDSGLWRERGPLQRTPHSTGQRVLAQYDAIQARVNPTNYDDGFGHGTHISAIIGNAAVASTGRFQGVAPGVNLVSVKALDNNGGGRYFDVIRGIQWIVSN
ncbi:MAG TPA: S8 family serine peptidase, partial [Steroidobacteraceae bacterium]|nr:S8 family serine peptidase [Steroidobacteraceae bacterium]